MFSMMSINMGFGMNMREGILGRAVGMAGGISIGAGIGSGSFIEAQAGIFGADSVGFSPEAMMGGGSSFFHPLMGGNFGMPNMGIANGMGMVPGMMSPMMMGMQNQQMLLMMMMLLKMILEMLQGNGMYGMGMAGYGMPGGFGSPLSMGAPGGFGGFPAGSPGGYGSPVGMIPRSSSPAAGGAGKAAPANPNVQIPNFGRNPSKAQVNQMLEAASKKYGIPANILKAVAWQESGWRANASSFDGGHGKGIMQIDDRFHQFARTNEVWDPVKNIDYGAKYLRSLYDKTGSWQQALKRYNGSSKYPPKIFAHARNQPWKKYVG